MPIPTLTPVLDTQDLPSLSPKYDALVVVSPVAQLNVAPHPADVTEHTKVDKKFGTEVTIIYSSTAGLGGRLIFSPITTLDNEGDDVRAVGDAVKKGILRAKAAGSVTPLLVLKGIPKDTDFVNSLQVALLAVLEGLYERLQAREALGEDQIENVKEVGFVLPAGVTQEAAKDIVTLVRGIEEGRRLARDIGGPDPERMAPLRCAEYIKQAFAAYPSVKATIKDDVEQLKKDYPLLHAVARASITVPRHRPAVVHLEYTPDTYDETLLIAGKGVTYDTGGADVKAGGIMAGMSRDKCGAAAGAGVVLTAAVLKPAVKVVAELGFVRNSIGADSYVADEIITSHAGVRVVVGNTDAEGRMVLSDCLSHLRVQALNEKLADPKLITIATLTGHVVRSYGAYTAVIDNGPAQKLSLAQTLQISGHLWGDAIEVSTLRREDVKMIAPKNNTYDIIQCNNAASSATSRGHQFPAAFILKAAGFDAHGKNSATPLPFTHIDIAGSAMEDSDYQFGKPTAAPLVALTARYLLPKLTTQQAKK
jgi:leucyl aminopeptidase